MSLITAAAGIAAATGVYYWSQRRGQSPTSAVDNFGQGTITEQDRQYAIKEFRNGNFAVHGPNRENFLQLACRHGDVASVAALLPLAEPKQWQTLNVHGCNLFHLCVTDGDRVDVLRCIVNYLDAQPDGHTRLEQLISAPTSENQWTVLHLACAKGYFESLKYFFELARNERRNLVLPLNDKDSAGHTALLMASANGHVECLKLLLSDEECNIYLTNGRCKSCLYMSALNKREDIMTLLLDREAEGGDAYTAKFSPEGRKLVEICNFSGNSPLHASCLRGSPAGVNLLLDRGARVGVTSLSGDSPLHVCCQRNFLDHWKTLACLKDRCLADETQLEEFKRAMGAASSFGCNPVHDAAFCGNYIALELFCQLDKERFLECAAAIDNDGLTPILTLCRGIVTNKSKKFDPHRLLKSLQFFLDAGVPVNGGDFAKSTCLHFLCYSPPDDPTIIDAVRILLAAGADPTIEDTFGWSPLHAAAQTAKGTDTSKQLYSMLMEHTRKNFPDYLQTFNKDKPRNIADRTFVDKAGPHNQIPEAERNNVLQGDLSLHGVAQYMMQTMKAKEAEGKPFKVVVLVGAGISVNCGIPDFRSPDSGIYSRINPGQFSGEYCAQRPQEFYALVRELFGGVKQGTVKPSVTHHFLKLLADKGLLQRLYTQNIDLLEREVGIPSDLIVEAHGSFGSARCMACGKSVENMDEEFWAPIFDSCIPTCSACDQVLRPDVVFFGENLPERFFALHHRDLKEADMLIVMGTSLVVYPFASLVSMVPLLTPRLLINKKLSGPFTKISAESNYRDVAYEGDCDDGVRALANELGWAEELNTSWDNKSQ